MKTTPEIKLAPGLHREQQPCSPSFVPFGPEWEKEVMQHRKADLVQMFRKACLDRDGWKASHDNQVELKRIISSRPDLAERAPMVEHLVCERDEARNQLYRIVTEGFGPDDTITGETCAVYVLRRLGKSPENDRTLATQPAPQDSAPK